MIEANGLTKRYGDKTAVDDVTFTIRPGIVTGFLGPNGAGKSTTMRMVLGLDRPTSGSVTVNGRSYVDSPAPLHEVGALLEAKAVHTSRSAYNHLRVLAATHHIPTRRVAAVLDLVGLGDVGRKRVGAFSLGMGQRLGIASALLGDPGVIMLDEPINGLDPEGIRWVRDLLKGLAAEGRTVFVSSHLMSEMALTAVAPDRRSGGARLHGRHEHGQPTSSTRIRLGAAWSRIRSHDAARLALLNALRPATAVQGTGRTA